MNANVKKTLVAFGAASLMVVGIASAQDATTVPSTDDATAEVQDATAPARPANFMHDLILEYTGLDDQGLRDALQSGSTLKELIEANGKTVEDFSAAVLAAYDTQAADARINFETRLAAALDGSAPLMLGGPRDGFGLGLTPGMGQGQFGGRGGQGQAGPRGMGQGQFGPQDGQGFGAPGFSAPGTQNQQGQSDGTTIVPPIGMGA